VQCTSGATRLAGRMRLFRHSRSAGKLLVKNNIQVFSVQRDRDREWRFERCVTERLITETDLLWVAEQK